MEVEGCAKAEGKCFPSLSCRPAAESASSFFTASSIVVAEIHYSTAFVWHIKDGAWHMDYEHGE